MCVSQIIQTLVITVHKVLAIPKNGNSIYRKIYSFGVMIAVVYMTIYQLLGKIKEVYPTLKLSVIVLDAAACVLIAFLDVYDTTTRTFLTEKKFLQFYTKLKKIDKFLGLPPTKNPFLTGITRYKTSIITMHVIIFATFCNDLYSNTIYMGWRAHRYNVANFVVKYKFTWFVVHLHMSANSIRQRFCLLNLRVEDLLRHSNTQTQLINCMKCHDLLCDLIAIVNSAYSFQILIMDKIIALHVVETSFLSLWFVFEEFNALSFATNLIWSADFMICGALICFSLGRASVAAQRTMVLCQSAYCASKDEVQREILAQFSKQIALMDPDFCCLGFISVNYSLFLKMLVSICNYIVIVLQFHD